MSYATLGLNLLRIRLKYVPLWGLRAEFNNLGLMQMFSHPFSYSAVSYTGC
jgi:hypothetical protein